MLALLLGLGAGLPAWASGQEVWAALYNGRLIASMDQDPSSAVAVYETLLEHLSEDDPLHSEILYWLGRARFESGDVAGAMEALHQAAQAPTQQARARQFIGAIEMHLNAIDSLPLTSHFHEAKSGWVRGWRQGQPSDLWIEQANGVASLCWRVDVRQGEDDFIALPFDTGVEMPNQIELRMWARDFDARIRVIIQDEQGRDWSTSVILVPSESWKTFRFQARHFQSVDAPTTANKESSLHIRALVIRDVTGLETRSRGENQLHISSVEVR